MRDFRACGRIVIKAGTSILSDARGNFSQAKLADLCQEITQLLHLQKKIVLVSSGAIGLGMQLLKLKTRPKRIPILQACASMGQGKLMHAYEKCFSKKGIHTAQMLLTRDGLENRDRFLNARNTLESLIRIKALPIVNENDTVSTEEIRFGDNDRLSVQVGHLFHADLIVLLSDVDGFYLKDGSRVRKVCSETEIEQELMKHLKGKSNEKSAGGMKAKLESARVAMKLGIPLLILNGHEKHILSSALRGEDKGTLFIPGISQRSAKEKWIAFSAPRSGALVLDDGACKAVAEDKRSLLARGITKIVGEFQAKKIVELQTSSGEVFGRGIVRYSSRDLNLIAGKKSQEIQSILGYKVQDEVIHRNDLVVWK